MLEYIYFHPTPRDLFIDWLTQQNLQPESSSTGEEYEVRLPEDIDDDLFDAIEAQYEIFLELNERLMKEENPDTDDYHRTDISVHLRDGTVSHADIDPELLGRLFGAISAEEFNTLVTTIVAAVENPQTQTKPIANISVKSKRLFTVTTSSRDQTYDSATEILKSIIYLFINAHYIVSNKESYGRQVNYPQSLS